MVEQRPVKPEVAGSSPAKSATNSGMAVELGSRLRTTCYAWNPQLVTPNGTKVAGDDNRQKPTSTGNSSLRASPFAQDFPDAPVFSISLPATDHLQRDTPKPALPSPLQALISGGRATKELS